MDRRKSIAPFDLLFSKYVPHILEKIFLSLDYESFKLCLQVNSTWEELLTSEPYQKKGESVFHDEIVQYEERLWQTAKEGNVKEVKSVLSSIFVNVDCVRG